MTEAELNLGFELLEKADRNLAADIGVYGIVSGAVPTQHAPLADLTLDLTAPARAYGAVVADVFSAFQQAVANPLVAGKTCNAGLLNVDPEHQGLCDIHPSQSGQALIARTIARTFRRLDR